MINIDKYYTQKCKSLHGLAKDYAENEGVGYIPYQILMSELLSLTYAMEYYYGEEGKGFLWGTVKAYAVRPPHDPLASFQSTPERVSLGEELLTLGEILNPVYSYLEESGDVKIHKLPAEVLNEPLPNKDTISMLHPIPVWDEVVEEREVKVYDTHVSLDQGDEWSATSSMYHADVLGFQLWLMKYSELITEQQTMRLNDSGNIVRNVGGVKDLGVDNLGQIFYDIMWDLTLKTLQELGEIPPVNIEEAMKLWRSRFAWVAGPENTTSMLSFLNNHIPRSGRSG